MKFLLLLLLLFLLVPVTALAQYGKTEEEAARDERRDAVKKATQGWISKAENEANFYRQSPGLYMKVLEFTEEGMWIAVRYYRGKMLRRSAAPEGQATTPGTRQ